MTTKFKLAPAPTFKQKVEIPMHGGGTVPVEFEFKHRTREQLDEFYNKVETRAVEESILDICVGWELEDPFTLESLQLLCTNYIGAPTAIAATYSSAIMQAKLGN